MRDENPFCVYWLNGKCRLKRIDLDIRGTCTECVYVSLSKELLERERQKQLTELEGRRRNGRL